MKMMKSDVLKYAASCLANKDAAFVTGWEALHAAENALYKIARDIDGDNWADYEFGELEINDSKACYQEWLAKNCR